MKNKWYVLVVLFIMIVLFMMMMHIRKSKKDFGTVIDKIDYNERVIYLWG
jgi:hypothetical protein